MFVSNVLELHLMCQSHFEIYLSMKYVEIITEQVFCTGAVTADILIKNGIFLITVSTDL